MKVATNFYANKGASGLENTAHADNTITGTEVPVRPIGPACLLATHCDLAVMRCLFCAEWSEAGVHWSLRYLFIRLLEIRTEWFRIQQETRKLLKLARDCITLRQLGYSSGTLSQSQGRFGQTNWRTIFLGLRSLSMPNLLDTGSFGVNNISAVTPTTDTSFQSHETGKAN